MAPPDDGRTVLRPPYFGAEKPLYSTAALRADLLPSLAAVGEPPSLDDVYQQVRSCPPDPADGAMASDSGPGASHEALSWTCYGWHVRIPHRMAWLFPEHHLDDLDVERDARLVLARVLEHGRMEDVRWCVQHYGLARIHRFFRDDGHPEVSPKTIALWRAALNANEESWQRPLRSRLRNAAPWPG